MNDDFRTLWKAAAEARTEALKCYQLSQIEAYKALVALADKLQGRADALEKERAAARAEWEENQRDGYDDFYKDVEF